MTPIDPALESGENAQRFRLERELRDRMRRAEEAAIDREVERIKANGERVVWIRGVPTPASLAPVFLSR